MTGEPPLTFIVVKPMPTVVLDVYATVAALPALAEPCAAHAKQTAAPPHWVIG